MDSKDSIYTEKKIAYYESNYRTSVLSKPQEVNLTLTVAHIYGLGYVCEQCGTQEDDPVYSRFSCGLEEISKVYINEYLKSSPLYVQCDEYDKGVVNRKRIIIPNLENAFEVVDAILGAKKLVDERTEYKKKQEHEEKLKKIEEQKDIDKKSETFEDKLKADKDDPINGISKYLDSIEAEVMSEADMERNEEKTATTESMSTSPVNPDDNIDDNKQNDNTEAVNLNKKGKKAAPIKEVVDKAQNEAEAARKAKNPNAINVDDVISEILDNLQTKAEIANESCENGAYEEPADKSDEETADNIDEQISDVAEECQSEEKDEKHSDEDIAMQSESEEKIYYEPKGTMSLDEFEASVNQLKRLLDSNEITREQFVAEKKKLINRLY